MTVRPFRIVPIATESMTQLVLSARPFSPPLEAMERGSRRLVREFALRSAPRSVRESPQRYELHASRSTARTRRSGNSRFHSVGNAS
jgi:hypothetical protein